VKSGIFFFLVFAVSCLPTKSQNKIFSIVGDIFAARNFIENKGQFSVKKYPGIQVDYVYDCGKEKIYFTKQGLIYELRKQSQLSEYEREEIEQGSRKPNKEELVYVNVNWLNANSNPEINGVSVQNFYYTFGDAKYNSRPFKEIIYRNLYPNIDLVYTLPENKAKGIKYSFIVKPGGDPGQIRISYSGDVKKIYKSSGGIRIVTPATEIFEHAPESFNPENHIIASTFLLEDKIIGFSIPEDYDRSKTLIIDPWVTTFNNMQVNNCAYDVDYDATGNLYVYGGFGTSKIAKYSPAGSLLWIFSGSIPAASWTTDDGQNGWLGNFAVNRNINKIYAGSGLEFSGSRIVRLDALGNYDNFVSTPYSYYRETWDMQVDCSSGRLYTFGGGTTGSVTAGIIDQTTGTVNLANFTGTLAYGQDVESSTIDNNGNIFLYFCGQTLVNNKIMRVNPSFNGNAWFTASTYTNFTEANTKLSYTNVGLPIAASNGFNCLDVNDNFLYLYNGFNLAAYDKNSGAVISSTTIPSQTIAMQGGIASDECNNVYVGGNGSILVYYFNGTVFNLINSIPLGIGNANQYITDIKLDKSTNLLYVCGTGFTGVYAALASMGCGGTNQYSLNFSCNGINNGSAVVTVSTAVVNPTINYIWTTGNNTVSSTLGSTLTSNAVNNLSNGIYTVQVQINGSCTPAYVNTLSINCCQSFTVVPSVTQSVCPNSASLSFVGTGTIIPTVTWTPAPGALSGNSLIANSLPVGTTTIVSCLAAGCNNNSITISVFPPNLPTLSIAGGGTICGGMQTTLTASGASTYSWSNGSNAPSIIVSPTSSTTYTVMGTAVNGCSDTLSVNVTVASCTGLPSLTNGDQIVVHPNPNSGIFSVSGWEETQFFLTNELGQIILEGKLTSENSFLFVSPRIECGVYYLVTTNQYSTHVNKILILR
jgi:hypothetical protein